MFAQGQCVSAVVASAHWRRRLHHGCTAVATCERGPCCAAAGGGLARRIAGPAAVVPEPYPEPAGRAARPTATRDSGRAARRPRWRAPGGCPAGCWSRARSPRSSTTASRATARCGALRVRRRPGAQPPPGWRPVSLHWVQSCPGAAAAFGEECRCGSANFISADGARHALQTLFSWRRHGILASRTACGVVACGSVIRSQQAADLHSPKLAATVQAYSTAVQPALAGSAAAVAYMWG